MRRASVVLTAITLVLGVAAPAVAQEGSLGIVDTSTGEWYLRDLAGNTTRCGRNRQIRDRRPHQRMAHVDPRRPHGE